MRLWRNSLTTQHHQQASRNACWKLARWPFFKRAQHIALYWPSDGEISPTPLLRIAAACHKTCYLPRLPATGFALQFAQIPLGGRLTKGRFGINQPSPRQSSRPIGQLDLLLLPLVAFDPQGQRLGMGGGFYDRALALIKPRDRTCVVGLAYQQQQVPQLPTAPWDKPLQWIVTPRAIVKRSMGK